MLAHQIGISRFHMSCAQAHRVGSKSISRAMQLKLHKPTMAIDYSLLMCARHVDSTNPGPSNLVFRTKPIPETEMSTRLIIFHTPCTWNYYHSTSPATEMT